MTKYIFCILLGTLLLLGIQLAPGKGMQKIQPDTTMAGMESCTESIHCASETVVIEQSFNENRTVRNERYTCKTDNVILGNSFSPRHMPPSKILKINPTSLTVRILSFLNSHLSLKSSTDFVSEPHLIKYSYRYCIYALGRMLV
ncbi:MULTISPECIES: hypothetical protein [Bacteroides]|uniref:hypothetical protein n=1 Tax=Bacteroides TaxID=816 RepID=UPI000694F595|nr:hypothetical protein [Bacteroides neonati]